MKVFFNNTNLFYTTFQAKPKASNADSRIKLNVDLTKDTVQILKKHKLTDKQLEKIKNIIENRPEEVQNVYKTNIKYLNNEISNSDFINELGVSTEKILSKKIPVYNDEAKFLSNMANKTDMFHPAAVDEKYFNDLVFIFLKNIKK